MEHIWPVIDTLLWVALVGGIVWRFHRQIDALLAALADRVKSGDDIKAGWFSLTNSQQIAKANREIVQAYRSTVRRTPKIHLPHKRDPESQRDSMSYSVRDVMADADFSELPSPVVAVTHESNDHPTDAFRAKYFLIEDLALRAVQAEYEQPISRQITGGNDDGFDGGFVEGGRLNIVEIKYVAADSAYQTARLALLQIQSALKRNQWRRARVVLVIVTDEEDRIVDLREQLAPLITEFNLRGLHIFATAELESEFGVMRVASGGE